MDERGHVEPAVRWRVARHVLMRCWDGEVLAYNDVTGHTHHFMDLAAWMFEQLAAHAQAEAELLAVAVAELELPKGGDLAASVRNSLRLFERHSLLEAVPAGCS